MQTCKEPKKGGELVPLVVGSLSHPQPLQCHPHLNVRSKQWDYLMSLHNNYRNREKGL